MGRFRVFGENEMHALSEDPRYMSIPGSTQRHTALPGPGASALHLRETAQNLLAALLLDLRASLHRPHCTGF